MSIKSSIATVVAIFITTVGFSQNPLNFGSNIKTADPSGHVWKDGKIYLYTSHDEECQEDFWMKDWHVFSSGDLINWTDHGACLSVKDLSWADNYAWAPDCAYKNGKYYFCFPVGKGVKDRVNPKNSTKWMGIGIAVSDSPTGPFVDAIGGPLWTKPYANDPCIFIDDDGKGYVYFNGGGSYLVAELADDLLSVKGDFYKMDMGGYEPKREGPWVFKRDGIYYYTMPEENRILTYYMGKSPLGPWEYKGVIMEQEGESNNHHSIVEFKGQWILFYHRWLDGNSTCEKKQRQVCAEYLTFNADGTIQKVKRTDAGLAVEPKNVSDRNEQKSYLNMPWKQVATRMPDVWYGSDEAKMAADSVLKYQTEIGGWPKNSGFHNGTVNQAEMAKIKKTGVGGTFDNEATITELRFLAKVYSLFHDERYKKAFEKGLGFVFSAQYENGGWPQYFPVKKSEDEVALDHTKPYSMHITYNDNAMVNTMRFLRDIFSDDQTFASLQLSKDVRSKAQNVFDKGVGCILKTQIVVDGKPTVWCAQHDEITLAPANARAYELASFSGAESVGIIMLLMDIKNPSKEIINSVNGAVIWFENHKIEGEKIETEIDKNGQKNRHLVDDKNAPASWARFYDLETQKPFFCSRDGIKRNSLAEISYERRNGYSWYTDAPEMVLKRYPEWVKKVGLKTE